MPSMPAVDPNRVMSQGREQIEELATDSRETVMTVAEEFKCMISRHPYATVAAEAGFAFVPGALWTIKQPRSGMDALWDQLLSRVEFLRRRWR